MANITTTFRKHLVAQSGISDLVSARAYDDHLPQGATLPALVIEEITSSSYEHLGGYSGLAETRLRCRCYGAEPTAADQLRDAVFDEIKNNYRGDMQGTFVSGTTTSGRGTGVDPPGDGSNDWRPYRWIDVAITHAE